MWRFFQFDDKLNEKNNCTEIQTNCININKMLRNKWREREREGENRPNQWNAHKCFQFSMLLIVCKAMQKKTLALSNEMTEWPGSIECKYKIAANSCKVLLRFHFFFIKPLQSNEKQKHFMLSLFKLQAIQDRQRSVNKVFY